MESMYDMQGLTFAELGLKLGLFVLSLCSLHMLFVRWLAFLSDETEPGVRNFIWRAVRKANDE